jgi:hypothetical protein
MSESLMDRLDIYLSEIDYSVSPGGIDQWEMHIEFPDRTAYFSGFDTAKAIDMLIAQQKNLILILVPSTCRGGPNAECAMHRYTLRV